MTTTGNASNTDSREGANSLQTLDKEKVDFPGSVRYYINNEGALMPRTSRKDTNMTMIYLATAADMTLAFSNIGSAFTFIQDSHADLNPEGSALMLHGVPATTKAVKSSRAGRLSFTVSGADAASQVAAAQSKLDGAIAACALVGVDPDNVAKVAELREELTAAMSAIDTGADSVELSITAMVLHKRGYNK